MERAKPRQSQFIDRWSRAEYINSRLTVIAVGLLALCLVLAIGCVYLAVKPRAIYYIPGATEAGVARPQRIPYATVGAFAASWVLNWSNFTPATVEEAYTRAGRFMSPHLAARTKARLDKDVQEVTRNNISSLFSLAEDPQVSQGTNGFIVVLRGQKGVYVGKEEIKTQQLTYTLIVRQVNPTDTNPYGLRIDDISQEEK